MRFREEATDDLIREQSRIYGRDPTKKITAYHQRVNEAAFTLAKKNLKLLHNHQQLLQVAQREVYEAGYQYKKGTTRSKRLREEDEPSATPRRKKMTMVLRLDRISALEEDLKVVNEQLYYKEKERDSASNTHQYRRCEQLTEEMGKLKAKRREFEVELKMLNQKERRSQAYMRKLSSDTSSTSSSRRQSPWSPTTSHHFSPPSCAFSHSSTPLSPMSHSPSPNPTPSPFNRSDSSIQVTSTEDDTDGSDTEIVEASKLPTSPVSSPFQ